MNNPVLLTRENLAVAAACSKDATRTQFGNVHVMPDGTTEATDGHWLVRVGPSGLPVADFPALNGASPQPWDGTLLLPCEAAKATAKALPKRTHTPILAAAIVGAGHDAATVRATVTDLDNVRPLDARRCDMTWPNTDQVIPKPDADGAHVVYLDANLAAKVFAMLSSVGDKAMAQVRISIPANPLHAIRLDMNTDNGQHVTAVMMPTSGPKD